MSSAASRPALGDKHDELQNRKLQKEADEMEVRLRRLRGQMDEERALREAKLANLSGGRMWKSSGSKLTGNLRHEIAGRGSTSMPSGAPARVIACLRAERESGSAEAQKAAPSSHSSSESLRSSISMPSGAPARVIASLRAERSAHSSAASSPHASRAASARQASTARAPASQHSTPQPGPCASQATPTASASLLQGDFDESEAHASFLAALAEWRGEPPPAAAPAAPAPVQVSTACNPEPLPSRSTASQAGAPLSYFERLRLRQKAAAAGAQAATLTACDADSGTRPQSSAPQRPQNSSEPSNSAQGRASPDSAAHAAAHASTHTAAGAGAEAPVVEAHSDTSSARPEDSADHEDFTDRILGQLGSATPGPSCAAGKPPAAEDPSAADEVLVMSIQSAHPAEAITSRCRLPDQVVLPA